ncbi:DUF2252 family protein [Novosphingobium sp. PhB165]|uniref:DUF2252 family protein n=1 Tax=Novosphingobium sp. PhB165 TaxID=2485105 RepID=UPI00104FB197|nr:DUF2252 family protein [Novosphingobium sp. PhB165]
MKALTPADRVSFLHARRDLKMARSAHAFVRGNTARFYEWLADSPVARIIPEGPPIWICGDCHLGNLGPIADSNGNVAIQIRDLDQAVIGNPAHDLIRLGLSLATAARGSDLPGVVTARMIEEMVQGYEEAFASVAEPAGGEDGNSAEPQAVRTVRRRALGRKWRHLARERLEDVEPAIPIGKRFWPVDIAERAALREVITHPPVSRMILSLDRKGENRTPIMADAAYWMKGCSSLGLMRFAIIVAMKGDEGTEYALVDMKEAVEPVAPAAAGVTMPADPAERVLTAALALSPYLGERIAATKLLGHSMFVRELMPQDLKIEVDQFSHGEALKAARYLSGVVGKAHARQMDAPTRRAWVEAMEKGHSSGLDAPSWLWRSVVALAARHEAGYLEHCRIYAMMQ